MQSTVEADDLLEQLGRRAREDRDPSAADDPVWERLARGELEPSEAARLRERAAADPEIATLYEAFRPLDDSTQERIATRVADRVAERPRITWRRAALVAGPLAAAAVIVLALRLPRSTASFPAVPEYSLDLAGGDRATRSGAPAETGTVAVHRESRLEIVLRPKTSVSGPVVVRSFLVRGDDARPWNVPMDRSPDGAVRIAGQAGTMLGVAPGSWDLAFTVGPAGAAEPDPHEVAKAVRGDRSAHPWQLLDARVLLLEGP